jgi:hypothetical protein
MASEKVNLRIRIPLIYSCMTDGCNELTRVAYCESCFDDILKTPYRKLRYEQKPSALRIQNTLREGFVSIERRASAYYLSG